MNKFLVFLSVGISISISAQSDLDKDQQLVYSYLYSKQNDKAKELLESKFLNSSDVSKQIIGWVYLADNYSSTDDFEKIVESLEKAKKLAQKSGNELDFGYVNYGYSRYYLNLKKEDLFLKSVNNAIQIFSNHKNENFILAQLYYLKLKSKTQNLLEKDTREDIVKANNHALKSKNDLIINFTYNNLAYYYKQKFDKTIDPLYIDSVKFSYAKTLDHINLIEEPSAKKRSLIVHYLNQGLLNFSDERQSKDEVLQNYLKGLELTVNDKSLEDLQSFLYNNVGAMYMDLGRPQTAESYYLKAYQLGKENPNIYAVYRIRTLSNLANYYAESNQFKKAYEFEKETKDLIQSENQKQFDNNTKSLELFYESERKSLIINQLEEKNNNYNKQKYLLFGISILAIVGTVFMIFLLKSRQKINRQKTDILEAEKKQAELILQLEKNEKEQLMIEQELLSLRQEHLEKQALAARLELNHKLKFLEELKKNINQKDFNINRFLKDEQATQNEFYDIQNIINEVHPNFFKKLQEVSKVKLTNLDLKYAAYIYLNMDNQQIATILKAESNTVRTTKYRLKQKLELGKEDDLHLFLQGLISNS